MNKGTKVLIILMFVAGVSLLSYPHVSNLIAEHQQRQVIDNYLETLETINEERYSDIYNNAQAYNKELFGQQQKGVLNEGGLSNYSETLKIDGSEVMAFIEIPSANIRVPIYHGTDENVLQVGVGHYGYSSLPIGGESTHAVLFGHSALPHARLFTDLEKLQVGDLFDVGVLNQKLYYRVTNIEVIEPNDLADRIFVVEGEDLVTLVTCTPYGVNTHRLVVTGKRTEISKEEMKAKNEREKEAAPILAACIIIVAIIICATLVATVMIRRKKHAKK